MAWGIASSVMAIIANAAGARVKPSELNPFADDTMEYSPDILSCAIASACSAYGNKVRPYYPGFDAKLKYERSKRNEAK